MKYKVFVMPAIHLGHHILIIFLAVEVGDDVLMEEGDNTEPALHPAFHNGPLHTVGVKEPSFQQSGVAAHLFAVILFLEGEEGIHCVGECECGVLYGAGLLYGVEDICVILPHAAYGDGQNVQIIFVADEHIGRNIDKIRVMIESFYVLQLAYAAFAAFNTHNIEIVETRGVCK